MASGSEGEFGGLGFPMGSAGQTRGGFNLNQFEAMVKLRQEQQLKEAYTGNYGGDGTKPATRGEMATELGRLRGSTQDSADKKDQLMSQIRILQGRLEKPGSWEGRLREELMRTEPLEHDCRNLRDELDDQHKKRMESFEIQMKPIIIRDGPSKKANYKIQAAKVQYDIYSLLQRLRVNKMRSEHEEKMRENVEQEVRYLRDTISNHKIHISTITKGVPMSKIEVREEKRSSTRSPDREMGDKRSISLPSSSSPHKERSLSPPLKHSAHISNHKQSIASEIFG